MKSVIFLFKIVSAVYIAITIFLLLSTIVDYFLGLRQKPGTYGADRFQRTVTDRMIGSFGWPVLLFSNRGRKFLLTLYVNIL